LTVNSARWFLQADKLGGRVQACAHYWLGDEAGGILVVPSYLAHYKHTFSHMSFAPKCKKQYIRKSCDFKSRITSNLAVLLYLFHSSCENNNVIALYSIFTNASKILGSILLIILLLMLCKGAEINP